MVEVGRCKMKSLLIDGGCVLNGQIKVQGSKNAALPIIAASLLFPGKTVLQECPQIRDVELMKKLLECLGCEVNSRENCLSVEAGEAKVNTLPVRWVGGMRSSILLLGAMLARFHSAVICYPGGCVIGERPIDLHIMALEKLGAEIHIEGECIIAKATNLKGCKIQFPISSVGATEQAILAACGAQGITDLYNAATEPEVVHLCGFLHSAGIEIQGIGCKHLRITGQSFAKNYPGEIQYTIPADRIVAGTYLLMAAACGGEIYLENGQSQEMEALLAVTRQLGSRVEGSKTDLPGGIFLKAEKNLKAPEKIVTGPYPEFPTDMQPILAATLSKADGESIIEAIVIFSCITVNILMGFFQELKSENAIDALKTMTQSKVQVKRDGVWVEIDTAKLVVGDVIQLQNNMGRFYHTLLVTGYEDNTYLVAAHTDDAFDRRLDSYIYANARFLHIEGVRKCCLIKTNWIKLY